MGKLIILVAHSRGKENFLRNKYTQLFPSKRYKGKTLTTLIFCWAKVSPSQHWVIVNSQIYFFRNVLKFLELKFFKASADDCFYVLHHHYTAIFHFNWCNRTQYDIQHHKLIDDLLQKQSDIAALRKRCFEIFWKLTEALLRWNTFWILKFLVAIIVFLFLFDFFNWEADYQRHHQ